MLLQNEFTLEKLMQRKYSNTHPQNPWDK